MVAEMPKNKSEALPIAPKQVKIGGAISQMETTKKKKKGKRVVQEKQAETSDIDLEMIMGSQPQRKEEKKEPK